MSEHPIQGMMGTSMDKIREMVDVNTIIGDPITCPDGTVVIPVSKVGFGFAAGGSDWPSKQPKDLFGGASGAGVSIQPIAFLVVSSGEVKILQLTATDNTANRLVGIVPDLLQSFGDLVKKPKEAKTPSVKETKASKEPKESKEEKAVREAREAAAREL